MYVTIIHINMLAFFAHNDHLEKPYKSNMENLSVVNVRPRASHPIKPIKSVFHKILIVVITKNKMI